MGMRKQTIDKITVERVDTGDRRIQSKMHWRRWGSKGMVKGVTKTNCS